MPGYVGCQHAAAAMVDLEELAWAGAATEEGNFLHNSDGSGDTGMHDLNYLHDAPNSDGMETNFGLRGAGGAATDLPAAKLWTVSRIFQMVSSACMLSGGHGVAASVLGTLAALLLVVMAC